MFFIDVSNLTCCIIMYKYIPTMVSVYIVKKNIVIYTHIAASGGKIQTLLVYHRTVVILKSLKSVVKFRYIETGLVL